MWSSSFYLGSFLGPTVSGMLVDLIGFPKTSFVFFIAFAVMFAFSVLGGIHEYKRQNREEENAQ